MLKLDKICIRVFLHYLSLSYRRFESKKKNKQINRTFYFFISFNIVINPDIEINFVIGEKV